MRSSCHQGWALPYKIVIKVLGWNHSNHSVVVLDTYKITTLHNQTNTYHTCHLETCVRMTNGTYLGPLHMRDWEPITLQALSLVEKVEPVQVHFTLHLRDQRSTWMQHGCKVDVNSYMALNGLCFMVTWTTLKNDLLEVGLTQNRETMALRMGKH